jgi:hypothetical protein
VKDILYTYAAKQAVLIQHVDLKAKEAAGKIAVMKSVLESLDKAELVERSLRKTQDTDDTSIIKALRLGLANNNLKTPLEAWSKLNF